MLVDQGFSPAYDSSLNGSKSMPSREERKKLRNKRRSKGAHNINGKDNRGSADNVGSSFSPSMDTEDRYIALLNRNEDELLKFVAQVNKVYQDLLKRPAPFMTFVFCGMQSAGKSTIMERFLNSVLNIVQQGTGTRCPLDATCIHDTTCNTAVCELYGEELPEDERGDQLTVNDVFERITNHNKKLGDEDRFSTEPLYLNYRSANVQNMRFVDTPGIISNQSTGKDNREDIKSILRSEMRKPNTKLCVLLEPKEFATNPILDFCDDTLGGRKKWIDDATFLMTKFDKQLEDARTSTKANDFFDEFFLNKCRPHLVITPTLDREDLPPDKLFEERTKLIQKADVYENDKFEQWREGHERYCIENGGVEDPLHIDIETKIGFPSAKKVMREIMLKDTIERLPEVISSLRNDLDKYNAEYKNLEDKMKFNDPQNLRNVVTRMLFQVQDRILNYLDGDLELSLKFPDKLQTLDDELDEEEDSEWSTRSLNHHSEKEDHWRGRVSNLDEFPDEIYAASRFLGGKQYQRALEFFRVIMIDALPDPFQLRDKVANLTGFLSGGLQQENWERAMVEITRVCLKDVSHPGLNYVIKHIGSIFRRLFPIALQDVKQGERFSAEFKQIPAAVERFLQSEFDSVLWNLLKNASNEVHSSMEPMYSSIDPNLPTFHCKRLVNHQQKDLFVKKDQKFVSVDEDREKQFENSWLSSFKHRAVALINNDSNNSAKLFLKDENRKRATTKKSFLPDERAAMITKEETEMILQRSFEYIVGLMEFNLIVFRFQLNYHLFEGFKKAIKETLLTKVNDADWDELVRPDSTIGERLEIVEKQRQGLQKSLDMVLRMQRII
ncbi:unnamed protein product [Pseudo-nitzschia multistriata]|uniref:Dynamin N-terminal domain-containing protein n=1 Tax=Pseudo-nitzschia multistriata TaxID=183589 RepID=A0A448ZFH1_9STRA|nr:unnamed protein product [Pseudo-nitzschia multistriata]